MYGHTYSKSMDQPGKVANPARGQLNRENISLSAFAPENSGDRDHRICQFNVGRKSVQAPPHFGNRGFRQHDKAAIQ